MALWYISFVIDKTGMLKFELLKRKTVYHLIRFLNRSNRVEWIY